jgi:Iodothyronine deiodinase
MAVNQRENVVYQNPQTYDDRTELAGTCSLNLGIDFPALVDTIDNSTEIAYTGWPDRLYVIDKDGRIAFKSAAGPFGFRSDQLANALEQIVQPDEWAGISNATATRK